jgi:hypothetical protein
MPGKKRSKHIVESDEENEEESDKCTICGGLSIVPPMLLCDNIKSRYIDNCLVQRNCENAAHINCLRPQLTEVPAGDWFCDCCDPYGTTKELMKYLEDHKQNKESLCLETREDYINWLHSLQRPLKDNKPLQVSEFDVSSVELLGMPLHLHFHYSTIVHIGRIIDRREDKVFGWEHLVRFQR